MRARKRFMTCPRCWGSYKEPAQKLVQCTGCKGAGSVEDEQLTKNFWLSEFLESDSALRRGIPNDPAEVTIGRLIRVACLLEKVRAEFGPIKVNSGFRSAALNRAIKGSKTSAHMSGWAADIDPLDAKVRHYDVVRWCVENIKKLELDQVIYEGTWIHLGLFGPNGVVRHESLMMFPEKVSNQLVSRYYPWDIDDRRVIL